MLAKLVAVLPEDEEHWGFEIKWDGIRGMVRVKRGALELLSRNQLGLTQRYPELQALPAALASRAAILDGEVGFDREGRPTFEALQQRMGLEGGRRLAAAPGVMAAVGAGTPPR